MRALTVGLVLLTLQAVAEEKAQIAWIGDWEEAFRLAKKAGKPVMVCINSKDGEAANERAAQRIYRDPWFVALSRRFFMLVVSTRDHGKGGPCPRFGRITCEQHLDCWKALRANYGDRFLLPATTDAMISPQHAWFHPDGTLLQRKEYELSKEELLKRMRAALAAVEGSPTARTGPIGQDAPLDARDEAELERVRTGDKESRWTALGNLVATEKVAVQAALCELLKSAKGAEVKCDVLRALGRAQLATARPAMEESLKHKDAKVRSFAAVALETLGAKESVPALLKRARTERDPTARKNVYRALGICGGPAADPAAAKALLKAVASDKQKMICRHAALALRHFEGPGAKLVCRKLEPLVLRTKDREVRFAIIYALAYVGDPQTSAAILEKALEKTHDDWAQSYVRGAAQRLTRQGKDAEDAFVRSARWLFKEDHEDPARKE
ncbi:MAG: HEAT repeat domain-containing protein [Planctomycetota bacterium]